MKKIFIFLLLSPVLARAHCPIAFEVNGSKYCTDVEWQAADKMVKGVLETTDKVSPFLNPENEIPQKWVYSRALFKVWADGDKSHVPVVLKDFTVFAFMVMSDEMHHKAATQWNYDESQGGYVLSGLALQEMEGCWELRWTVTNEQESQLIGNVGGYTNLNEDENKKLSDMCAGGSATLPEMHTHHH